MNLFRSEEHLVKWHGFDQATREGIISLDELLMLFSGNFFQRRRDDDFVSRRQDYLGELLRILSEMGKARPFWAPAVS